MSRSALSSSRPPMHPLLVLVTVSASLAAETLEFPEEGRWSVALGWQDGWPTDWRHADSTESESSGPWTIHHGALKLPGGKLILRDSERLRGDGLRELRRRWKWTGTQPLETVTLSIRLQTRLSSSRPFFPAISYYGNPAGRSTYPERVPLLADDPGARAFYEDHRFSMPVAAMEGVRDDRTWVAALQVTPSTVTP